MGIIPGEGKIDALQGLVIGEQIEEAAMIKCSGCEETGPLS